MSKQTIQDCLAAALADKGEQEIVPSKSRKYRQFTRQGGGYYWLGRSGALRVGNTSSRSFAIDRDRILAKTTKITYKVGDKVLCNGEVYYVRACNGSQIQLSQNIDGVPTLSVLPNAIRPL